MPGVTGEDGEGSKRCRVVARQVVRIDFSKHRGRTLARFDGAKNRGDSRRKARQRARNSISIPLSAREKRRETRRGAGDTQIIADFHDVPGQSSVIRALLAGVLAGVKFNLSGPK